MAISSMYNISILNPIYSLLIITTTLCFISCKKNERTPHDITKSDQEVLIEARKSIKYAIYFLKEGQLPDGSWKSFLSRKKNFIKKIEQPRVYPTISILLSLKSSKKNNIDSTLKKGIDFIKKQMNEKGLWSLDGKNHSISNFMNISCLVPPDTDTTSLALILLKDELTIEGEKLKKIIDLYDSAKYNNLYRTYFPNYYISNNCPTDYMNIPSLGVNINIYSFFSKYGLKSRKLENIITNKLKYSSANNNIYYNSNYILDYFVLRNKIKNNKIKKITQKKIIKKIMLDIQNIKQISDIDLGALLFSYTEINNCNHDNKARKVSDSIFMELKTRQNKLGAWTSGYLYKAGAIKKSRTAKTSYYGSKAETTAIVLHGINNYILKCFNNN